MLITESQMNFGMNSSILDSIPYLAESTYDPAMVPVVENSRLNANVVSIEHLMDFAESNDISDLGYALTCVCEASEISPSTVVFSVEKVSLIENEEIKNITQSLLDEGVGVAIKPLSPHSGVSVLGEFCMNYGIATNDWTLLESFVDDDFHTLTETLNDVQRHFMDTAWKNARGEEAKQAITKVRSELENIKAPVSDMILHKKANDAVAKLTDVGNYKQNVADAVGKVSNERKRKEWALDQAKKGNLSSIPTELKKKYATEIAQAAQAGKKQSGTTAGKVNDEGNYQEDDVDNPTPEQLEARKKMGERGAGAGNAGSGDPTTAINSAMKEWQSKPRKWFAEKIAWLHDKAQEFNNKVKQGGDKTPWYKKILSYITRAIAFLTKKMHNLVAEKGHEISDKEGSYSSFYKAK